MIYLHAQSYLLLANPVQIISDYRPQKQMKLLLLLLSTEKTKHMVDFKR